jgi:hypothetical protein
MLSGVRVESLEGVQIQVGQQYSLISRVNFFRILPMLEGVEPMTSVMDCFGAFICR